MTIDKFPEPMPVSKQGRKIVLNEAQLEWLANLEAIMARIVERENKIYPYE